MSEALLSAIPALVVRESGQVVACNLPAAWLSSRERAKDLLLDNIYTVTATAIKEGHVPLCCNEQFAGRKLGMLRRLDPGRTLQEHRSLAEAVEAGQPCQYGVGCPPVPSADGRLRGWQYRFRIHHPSTRGESRREGQGLGSAAASGELLQFVVSDMKLTRPSSDRSTREKLFLVTFDPENEQTAKQVRKVVGRRTAQVGYVAPDVEHLRDIINFVYINSKLDRYVLKGIEGGAGSGELREQASVGGQLRQMRSGAGVSAEELAKRVGVSRAYVTHWETGRRPLQDPYYIRRILEELRPDPEGRTRFLESLGIPPNGLEPTNDHDTVALVDRQLGHIAHLDRQIADLHAERSRRLNEVQSLLTLRRVGGAAASPAVPVAETVFDAPPHQQRKATGAA